MGMLFLGEKKGTFAVIFTGIEALKTEFVGDWF